MGQSCDDGHVGGVAKKKTTTGSHNSDEKKIIIFIMYTYHANLELNLPFGPVCKCGCVCTHLVRIQILKDKRQILVH